MLEPPRIGLPNLVGQGELVARTRGAQVGAGARGTRHDRGGTAAARPSQRAEELPPTHRVEDVERDRDRVGTNRARAVSAASRATTPSRTMDEDGHLVDVTA